MSPLWVLSSDGSTAVEGYPPPSAFSELEDSPSEEPLLVVAELFDVLPPDELELSSEYSLT